MDNILHQAYSSEKFRQQGHKLIDYLADFLDNAPAGQEEEKVFPWLEPNQQLTFCRIFKSH
ncbi:hypothetical protein AHMF7605_03380 [Adhaeribacter arboris]|uniref:Uncharacterized protein n=1 Tax=Adhaeribacter arboris TaxID=2072846 RepID=A0A2T2YAV7_9BACT|nr:hypothetical protein [Adhaeribacter arboris]PSR52633.1 hypothetical protein AHMF7605_03380 [Adhaeribacter arboris]